MKKLVFILFISISLAANAGVIVLEGKYQSRNLVIQNGFSENGVGFCTFEVRVNGKVATDEINSSAFEVDFTQFQMKPGTPVTVEIKHKEGCKPKVLNPDALKSQATFDVVSINVSNSGLLKWTTKNENGSLPFVIEQFKWTRWIPVGEIQGKGTSEQNEYSYQLIPHSGENKFRVKQVGYNKVAKYSKPITFTSKNKSIDYNASSDLSLITFSSESLYEVYDDFGNILKKGFSKQVDLSNLKKGTYYLCYDNSVEEIRKK
ncbi:MAG: hypothetical protein J0M08_05705 [Bacteroidetes bacterium]|nr:hypothetical protein [Bacteroidota bacterium]